MSARAADFDMVFKIMMIGDSNVGKTCLLSRFTRNEFRHESRSTVGVEFCTKFITHQGKLLKAQIWDTAGQERYRSITNTLYRGAVGALLVYDVTYRESFEHLSRWLADLHKYASNDMLVVLVGNKCDLLGKRLISTEEGRNFAEKEKLKFIETSALDGTNVEKSFTDTMFEIHNKVRKVETPHFVPFKEQVIRLPGHPESKEEPREPEMVEIEENERQIQTEESVGTSQTVQEKKSENCPRKKAANCC